MKRSFVLAALILACAVGSVVFLLSASASGRKQQGPAAPAVTFTVTTTDDDGVGSLREAINQANASPGADSINFNIGAGTPSIPVGSLGLGPLPVITEAVTIDGATGGATRVELDGALAGGDGLFITSGNCIIRGLVINRFDGSGIVLSVNGTNVLQNSFIGTDSTGTASLGNIGDAGVLIDDSPNNLIGGTTPGAGNLISGNALVGVLIQDSGATNNLVQGNLIGTNINGTTPLGSSAGVGVQINGAPSNTIGGTTPGAGNLISGNGSGVRIFRTDATNNLVQGNLIGTNINGTAALPNAEHGVLIDSGADNNTIGGMSAAARNIISGNGGSERNIVSGTGNSGVQIGTATGKVAGENGNVVQGNFIGTDINGVLPLGNNGEGVSILGNPNGDPSGSTIGGTIPGAGNTIAFNTGSGVLIEDGAMHAVLSNSIFSNQLLGINLSDDAGITPNDPCDGDVGANNLQNFPDLTSASSDGGNTTIQGSLNSTASAQFRIEFFSNPSCDVSGNGEGASFLGFTMATTDPGCLAPFNVNLPVAVTVGAFITATATDLLGNTSEFSACIQVTGAGGCTISCPANIVLSNDPGACGAIATYPPPTTTGMCGTVTCTPPSGSFFGTGQTTVMCLTGAGPGCSFTITVNDTQSPVITCPANQTTPATVPGGATVTYPSPTVTDNCPGASASCVPPSGSLFPVGVTTVNCTGTDASSNSSPCGFTVTVTAQADLSITKIGSPNPVASGGNLTYVITINNAGPSSATGVTVTDAVPAGTTFVLVTTSQGTSTAPPVGGTGNVTCSLGTILLGGSANVTLVVNVNAAPGATISNTVVVSSTSNDPVSGNNSSTEATPVTGGGGCTISCPANIVLSNDPGACGAFATYPPPTTTGMCGTVTCTPPSGSFFGTGQTTVMCTTGAGPACAFTITVNDTQSPVITCPANQTTPATVPGGATVTYPSPTVTDNCPGASALCVPPSGSLFPVGVTTVNCTGTDASSNSSFCGFTITVTAQANLSITKIGSPNPVASGGNLTYVITINNVGPSSATGVTVSDAVPAGTTFVSVTTSQGTSTAPPVGGTGNVICSLGTILLGGSANVTLVVNVNAAPGATISNTVVVSSTSNDPVSGNNSSSEATPVIFLPCAVNCPADVVADTLPSPFNCGAAVSYPVPTTTGPCGGVICTPPSSSFFPLGVTLVSCATAAGPSCSFSVTVKDTIAPRITCSGNISTSAALGGNLLVVQYSSPLVVDNCSTGTAVCTPPSGSAFSLGTSMVTCIAQDAAGNTATCSFSITVIDNQAPTITCPPPVVVEAAAQQCTATVNYPPPMVADLGPGTTVVCAPPSGSTFPVGTTTVRCTATDAFGNRSTCTFAVTVEQSPLAFPAPEQFLAFGEETPVRPVRKPKKNPPSNCDCFGTFAITNTGCAVLGLNLASISRVGSDVATGRITNPDDTKFFSLRIVNADGSERPVGQLCGNFCIEIAPGQSQTFRVVFSPLIPAPSGKTTGLAARNVLPADFDSTIIFDTNRGGTLPVRLFSHVGTALQLINAAKPKKPASVSFVRSGDEFILTYSVFDANLDTTHAEYEMLDRSGAIVGQAIEVDLTQPIVDGQVFKGQSFIVSQRFSGATDNPQITSVRLTVFDAEASVSITRQLEVSASAASLLPNLRVVPATIQPRMVKLVRRAP